MPLQKPSKLTLRGAKTIIILALLANLGKQNEVTQTHTKLKQFTISKFQKDVKIDPGEATPGELEALQLVSQQTFLGSITIQKNSSWLTSTIYYRDAQKDSVGSSEVIRFSLRFSTNKEEDRTLTRKIGRSDRSQLDLQHQQIDQEFHVYGDKLLPGAYFARSVRLENQKSTKATSVSLSGRANGVSTSYTEYTDLIFPVAIDLYFEDDEFVYHFLAGKESIDRGPSPPAAWLGIVLLVLVAASCCFPPATLIIFELFTGNGDYLMKKESQDKPDRTNYLPGTMLIWVIYFFVCSLLIVLGYYGRLKHLISYGQFFLSMTALLLGRFLVVFTQ